MYCFLLHAGLPLLFLFSYSLSESATCSICRSLTPSGPIQCGPRLSLQLSIKLISAHCPLSGNAVTSLTIYMWKKVKSRLSSNCQSIWFSVPFYHKALSHLCPFLYPYQEHPSLLPPSPLPTKHYTLVCIDKIHTTIDQATHSNC